MTFSQILGVISGILLISGYVPYLYAVVRKTTTPNRASWFIWALSTTIILFGVKEIGTHEALWVPIADAVGCSVIFLLSLKLGVGGWALTDRISLLICLISVGILFLTGNALVALIMNLLIYVSGYIPTIRKTIDNPRSESKVAWSLFFAGVVLNLITVAIGTDTGFAVWLYPIVLVLTVGTLYVLLFRKKTTASPV